MLFRSVSQSRYWAYHNHEGHEEDGKEHINRHIHFIFDNVDNNGVMVRRNWKRDYFKQMQTDIFDISKKYIKNIERAKESEYEEVEIEDRIVKVNTRKQIHHRVFRHMKENEQVQELNLKFTDMMKERDEAKKENKSLKTQVTKTKNEKAKLKEELQALKDESKDLRFLSHDIGCCWRIRLLVFCRLPEWHLSYHFVTLHFYHLWCGIRGFIVKHVQKKENG